MAPTAGDQTTRAFVLEGSSLRMAPSPALTERFPLGSHQHGAGHWPVARLLVAHDWWTGLALRPEWGAMNGADAVSEQQLLEKALGRLPSGATVVGDGNFGVFSVAYAAPQAGHPVLRRLTVARAQRLAGGALQGRMDRRVVWKPSRDDRRSHPQLPTDACVSGRWMVRRRQPDNGGEPFRLALFSTLPTPRRELLKLYGQRWKIETDLGTLKTELCLDPLTCATPDRAAQEIEMGIAAYNLVRAVIGLAAEPSGLPPRDYGFTKARRIVPVFAPQIAAASDARQAQRLFEQMMHYWQQAKLPHRRRKRPAYPREVWHRGAKFPNRKP
jgi:hypothetical protein